MPRHPDGPDDLKYRRSCVLTLGNFLPNALAQDLICTCGLDETSEANEY